MPNPPQDSDANHDQGEQHLLPPLEFVAGGPTDEIKEANLESVLPSPGYPSWVLLMADAIAKRADLVLIDFAQQAVTVRYQIDGLWHNMPALDRGTGDYMLAAAKKLANLDYKQRRARQEGEFKTNFMKHKYNCRIISQGTSSGERVAIYIDRPKDNTETLQDLGMRPSMNSQVAAILNEATGIFLYSSLPKDGYTTGWRATLDRCDRYMRDFFVVEEKTKVEPEVINVASITYDPSAGETPLTPLRGLLLREPDALAFTEIPDGKTVDELSRLVHEDEKLVITRIPAKSAVEALIRVLVLEPDVKRFLTALRGVLYHRTVRKLCDECKTSFQPTPQMMQQLGLPPGRVAELFTRFQPRPQDLVDEEGNPIQLQPCSACSGLGYAERTGFFELLVMTDQLRQAAISNPTIQNLTAIAKQSGFISMRDEGVILVARGITSVEELQRVLKK